MCWEGRGADERYAPAPCTAPTDALHLQATYDKALRLVELYERRGIDTGRLYIKIASTQEGIEACRRLQLEGIDCNMTLLFSFAQVRRGSGTARATAPLSLAWLSTMRPPRPPPPPPSPRQAAACADAGAALISPFVGRIMDWYKAKEGRDFAPHEDPGAREAEGRPGPPPQAGPGRTGPHRRIPPPVFMGRPVAASLAAFHARPRSCRREERPAHLQVLQDAQGARQGWAAAARCGGEPWSVMTAPQAAPQSGCGRGRAAASPT